MDLELTFDHIKKNYPGFKVSQIEEFYREKGGWVSGFQHCQLYKLGSIERQLKRIIESKAIKVCVRLYNPVTDEILNPDIDIEKFIQRN
jgi:hypothetical protein